ncbi:PadR family transcriptional regulator [Hamadaea sp. NPDC050747]|uniref:PadR family transcriptional regulator n=1 Tax=Hamadaea sp. NPDC050747 TaxID=3155789 RepID=UPI0033FFC12E
MTVRSSPLALTVLALLMYKPQHMYGIQRLVQEWGKDLVVNVGQRTSLYRTVERLADEGLVAARETQRHQAYPERTVYEVTEAGREVARTWLGEMLADARYEFPRFPAALSHVLMISPAETADHLRRRLATLTKQLQDMETRLADQSDDGLDRVGLLEFEYLRAVTAAEAEWIRSVVDDVESGRLTWTSA